MPAVTPSITVQPGISTLRNRVQSQERKQQDVQDAKKEPTVKVSTEDQKLADQVTRGQVLQSESTETLNSYSFMGSVLKMLNMEEPTQGGLTETLVGMEKGIVDLGTGTLNGLEFIGRSLFGNEKQGGMFGNAPQQIAKDTVTKGTKVAETIAKNKDVAISLAQATTNVASVFLPGVGALKGAAVATNFLAALNHAANGNPKAAMTSGLMGTAKLFPQLQMVNGALALTQVPGLLTLLKSLSQMTAQGKSPQEMLKEINENPTLKSALKSFVGLVGGPSMAQVLKGAALIDLLQMFGSVYGVIGQSCNYSGGTLHGNSTFVAENNNPPQQPIAQSTDHTSLRAEKVPLGSEPGVTSMTLNADEPFSGIVKVEVFPGSGPVTSGSNEMTVKIADSNGVSETLRVALTVDQNGQTAKFCSTSECTSDTVVQWLNNRLVFNLNPSTPGVDVSLLDNTPKGSFSLPNQVDSSNGYDRVSVELKSDSDTYIFGNVYNVKGECVPIASSTSQQSTPSPTDQITSSPTDQITSSPTDQSTFSPTDQSTFSTESTDFSSSSPTGNPVNPDTTSPSSEFTGSPDSTESLSSKQTTAPKEVTDEQSDYLGFEGEVGVAAAGVVAVLCCIALTIAVACLAVKRSSLQKKYDNKEFNRMEMETFIKTIKSLDEIDVTSAFNDTSDKSMQTLYSTVAEGCKVALWDDAGSTYMVTADKTKIEVPDQTQVTVVNGRPVPDYSGVTDQTDLPVIKGKGYDYYIDPKGDKVRLPVGTKVKINASGHPILDFSTVGNCRYPLSETRSGKLFYVTADGKRARNVAPDTNVTIQGGNVNLIGMGLGGNPVTFKAY